MKNTYKSAKIFNLGIFGSQRNALLKIIEKQISASTSEKRTPLTIFTPNPEQIALASELQTFASCLGSADILAPDGVGLVFASRLLALKGSKPLKKRIAGVDLAAEILKIANQHDRSVLILGGRGYEKLQPASRRLFPNLEIEVFELKLPISAGKDAAIVWTPGFSQVSQPAEAEQQAVHSLISQLKPAVVFAAFGAPHQEYWICQNKPFLEKEGVLVVMAVGGAFDMLFGKLNRAPAFVRRLGLEWLYRLLQEPWRWRRQLKLVKFSWLTLKELFKL